MLERAFILAGRAIFTVEIPSAFATEHATPSHFTYRVERVEASEPWPTTYFVGVLCGPHNTMGYRYLGILEPQTGRLRLTAKSVAGEDAWCVRLLRRVLACLWRGDGQRIEAAGFGLHHEGRCGRCGLRLTVPESIESGFGPECIQKIRTREEAG